MHATRSAVSEHWAPAPSSRAASISPRTSPTVHHAAADHSSSRFTELPADKPPKETPSTSSPSKKVVDLAPPVDWTPPRQPTPILEAETSDEAPPTPLQPMAPDFVPSSNGVT